MKDYEQKNPNTIRDHSRYSRTNVKAVLFDLDDTLYDHYHSTTCGIQALQQKYACLQARSLEELVRAHLELLEAMHPLVLLGKLSAEDSRRERFRRLFARQGEHLEEAVADKVAGFYRDSYVSNRQVVPGAPALLRALRGRGITVAVVTNNVVAEQVEKVKQLGLQDLLDALVISEEAGVTKPDPAIFHIALQRIGARAEATVMLGDNWINDIEGAVGAGIRAVWLNRHSRAAPNPTLAAELRALEPLEEALTVLLGKPQLAAR